MRKDDTLKAILRLPVLLMLAFPLLAWAQKPASEVTSSPTSVSSAREKPFRARLGFLGGIAMQKPQFEVAVAWDFARLSERFRLLADFTLGLRPNEVTLEPMVGVRYPIAIRSQPKLEPWLAALLGLNLTFMRGGTAASIPLRLAAGLHYEVVNNLSLGLEVSVEFGPLIAPFADGYAAMHLGAVAAWAF